MDYLWSPWRYRYVSSSLPESSPQPGCLFCRVIAESKDQENFVLLRAQRNFVMLNAFPYTSGHLMVAPYAHVATLEAADPADLAEMMTLTRRAESALRRLYKADGVNIGMNIGRSAGAGIAGHIHMHVLPRWHGDVNFITTIAETRVLPEDLAETYKKLWPLMNVDEPE
jgi:ATP adenylyltransferase